MAKNKQPDTKPAVPSYIVTFSDMVTLLLTFFVLLLSMANTQDQAKFNEGQESIEKAIATFGLAGILPGKQDQASYDYKPMRFSADTSSNNPETIELEDQLSTLKRTVHKLEKLVTTSPSNIVGNSPIFETIGVKFSAESVKLQKDSLERLRQYCTDLGDSLSPDKTTMYVVGVCTDSKNEQDNRIISAKRAKFVRDYIVKNIPENPYWKIYYWGTGSGGDWVQKGGILDTNSHIAIAIITAE